MISHPVVLFRPPNPGDLSEAVAAARFFPVVRVRSEVKPWDLVIGRYSVLPYYEELEEDLRNLGACLINGYAEHRFVANISAWTSVLEGLTPETWTRLEDLPEIGPFVLKGETNSRKDRWNSHMFARTKREAVEVALRLQEDSLIGSQQICIRRYIPLRRLLTGLNDLPVSEEYRFFVCDGKVLTGAYYWSYFSDDLPEIPNACAVPREFLSDVVQRVKDRIRFFVVDIARKEDGGWMVVELNDAQMSGLSENDPEVLYRELTKVICK